MRTGHGSPDDGVQDGLYHRRPPKPATGSEPLDNPTRHEEPGKENLAVFGGVNHPLDSVPELPVHRRWDDGAGVEVSHDDKLSSKLGASRSLRIASLAIILKKARVRARAAGLKSRIVRCTSMHTLCLVTLSRMCRLTSAMEGWRASQLPHHVKDSEVSAEQDTARLPSKRRSAAKDSGTSWLHSVCRNGQANGRKTSEH